MKFLIASVLYLFLQNISYFDKFTNYIKKLPHLPKIRETKLPCKSDRDCISPYVCCRDPFYSFSTNFCCNFYQNHNFGPAYIIHLIQP